MVPYPTAHRPRRMVGGSLARDVPWHAFVRLGDTIFDGGFGGGALISDRWILTAGRNVFVNKSRQTNKGQNYTIPRVYLGVSDRKLVDSSNEVLVEKVVLHPEFQKTCDWDNDLALIKLKEPVEYSMTVMPIPLPERGEDLAEVVGTHGLVAGWGWGVHLTFADRLKYLVLPVAKFEACQKEYNEGSGSLPVVDGRVFCTGPSTFTENVCFGDGGGAFAVRDSTTGRVYAAGILSYDKTCTLRTHAVYMKLSAYLPWINSVMREDSEVYADLRTKYFNKMYSLQVPN
uniref:Peptidase S1 domain-containing protein n=1 Tax=Scleropages formosus TaxID=113540 RepID=A0A8C9VQ65_SCLFO